MLRFLGLSGLGDMLVDFPVDDDRAVVDDSPGPRVADNERVDVSDT